MREIKTFLLSVAPVPVRLAFLLKPNLMQMHSSYVVTDPKGTVLVECGKNAKEGQVQDKSFEYHKLC